MPAGTPPAAMAATSKMTHSGLLNPRTVAALPGSAPSAINDLAALATSAPNSAQLVACQRPSALT